MALTSGSLTAVSDPLVLKLKNTFYSKRTHSNTPSTRTHAMMALTLGSLTAESNPRCALGACLGAIEMRFSPPKNSRWIIVIVFYFLI